MTTDNNESEDTYLYAGFSDPVTEAQSVFRKMLKAMSEPGNVQFIKNGPTLSNLGSAAFSTLLTLADNETPLWLSPAFNDELTRRNLAFHCGSSLVEQSKDAAFILAEGTTTLLPEECNQGDPAWPDTSATVLLQVDAINPSNDQGQTLTLKGPGIQTSRTLTVQGLAPQWLTWLQQRHLSFPLGLDLILVSDAQMTALPRSVLVTLLDSDSDGQSNEKEFQTCTLR